MFMRRPSFETLEARALLSTVVVTTLSDETNANSTTSLREAISKALAGDTISFKSGLTGTITLGKGQLSIGKNLTITGPGASKVSVSGNNATRVFSISSGKVSISGLTIKNGRAADNGGGIFSNSTLTLSSCTISGNTAFGRSTVDQGLNANGGGIYARNTLTLSSCTFSNNQAQGGWPEGNGNGGTARGGAIFNDGAKLSITNCTFSGNQAIGGGGFGSADLALAGNAWGGAIYNHNIGFSISGSSFTSNKALGGDTTTQTAGGQARGGAIAHDTAATSLLSITKTTFSKNQATGHAGGGDENGNGPGGNAYGGAIWTRGATTLTGATVSSNAASGGAGGTYKGHRPFIENGGSAFGGGIFASAALTISASTISGNAATAGFGGDLNDAAGGGIYTTGKLTLSTSTIDSNKAVGGQSFQSGVAGASADGGGVYVNAASSSITASTFSANSVAGAQGAPPLQDFGGGGGPFGPAGNGGGARGGGLFSAQAITLINDTFNGNKATGGKGGFGVSDEQHGGTGGGATGGAIYDGTAKAASTFTNLTLAGNSAIAGAAGDNGGQSGGSNGGGIYSNSSPALKLANSIVALNNAFLGPDINGKIASQGHNLIGKNTGFSGLVSSDKRGTSSSPLNPKLGSLANNGGPTRTMALLTGSPAIDAGDNAKIASGVTTDQRGKKRIFNAKVDIGAFEFGA